MSEGNGSNAMIPSNDQCAGNSAVRDWTVMVYFAADEVDQHVMENLKRLKAAGSTNRVAFLAQINPPGASETTWYWLEKDTLLEEDVVARFSDADVGDPNTLIDFVTWAAKAAPAKHYMLILWGHGDGWQSEDNAGRIAGRTVRRKIASASLRRLLKPDVSAGANASRLLENLVLVPNRTVNGEYSPDILDSRVLKDALLTVKQNLGGRKIDILGMDSCLMAMVEVGYQLRDSVEYLVACEEVEPIDSWPYDFIFTELVRHPEMDALKLGQLIVRKYMISFKGEGRFVTQSVCDLSRCQELADEIDQLAVKLRRGLADFDLRTSIMAARAMAQTYYIKDYVDIYDFCDILATLIDDPEHPIARSCERVKRSVGNTRGAERRRGFVRTHGFYGYPLKDSHGASVYFPCRDFSKLYARLDFAKSTEWDAFIEGYSALAGGPANPDLLSENEGTVGAVHLGGQSGDGELGPGDPILIPDDPLCHHPSWSSQKVDRCGALPPAPNVVRHKSRIELMEAHHSVSGAGDVGEPART